MNWGTMSDKLQSALISVSDKSNLEELVEGIYEINPDTKIFSSGGTAQRIRKLGYEVTDVSFYTGFPEAPGGLVKTLHPKVHGGILLDKSKVSEKEYLDENGIEPLNLVVVNLYPFEKTVKSGATKKEIIENIDIGGPTLIRSAGKGALRHGGVAPVIEPEDYNEILNEMKGNEGKLSEKTINYLAYKAFKQTWDYDEKIRNWIKKVREGSENGISR